MNHKNIRGKKWDRFLKKYERERKKSIRIIGKDKKEKEKERKKKEKKQDIPLYITLHTTHESRCSISYTPGIISPLSLIVRLKHAWFFKPYLFVYFYFFNLRFATETTGNEKKCKFTHGYAYDFSIGNCLKIESKTNGTFWIPTNSTQHKLFSFSFLENATYTFFLFFFHLSSLR